MKNIQEKNIRSYTFTKKERLCSKKLFEKLFEEGRGFLVYPLKVLFLESWHSGNYPAQAAFAVSKKIFRKATIRNLLKRRMREAYRLNKYYLYSSVGDKKLILIFIYIGKEILDFHQIENSVKKSISIIVKNINNT